MVIKMNTMYSEGKNHKIIANTLNISPYTVKKYINNLKEEEPLTKIIFNKPLPEFNSSIFHIEDWGELCVLSIEESEEVRALWEELEF